MSDLINLLITNLIKIGYGLIIFLSSYVSNMVLGMFYNISLINQSFEKEKFLNGLFKALIVIIGIILMCFSTTTIPYFANIVGWEIPEQYSEAFGNLAILAIILTVSCKYVLEAFEKLKNILGYEAPKLESDYLLADDIREELDND